MAASLTSPPDVTISTTWMSRWALQSNSKHLNCRLMRQQLEMYFLPFDEFPLPGLSDGISSWISCWRVNSSLGDPGERHSFTFLRCCLLVSRGRIKKTYSSAVLGLVRLPPRGRHLSQAGRGVLPPGADYKHNYFQQCPLLTAIDWCETFTYIQVDH